MECHCLECIWPKTSSIDNFLKRIMKKLLQFSITIFFWCIFPLFHSLERERWKNTSRAKYNRIHRNFMPPASRYCGFLFFRGFLSHILNITHEKSIKLDHIYKFSCIPNSFLFSFVFHIYPSIWTYISNHSWLWLK